MIATPHSGGLVPQAIAHQALETTRQVAAILQGHPPLGGVNPEHATRLARLRGVTSCGRFSVPVHANRPLKLALL